MSQLSLLIQNHGVLLVFGTVLLEQFGLPIPALPVLVLAGAMAMEGGASWQLCLAAVLLACLICDYFWFRAGRRYGNRVLRLLCRISLSPDSCVNQTEDRFRRYGPKSLLVSKFIPGFNAIAAPMSGALGTDTRTFLGFAATGALLWGGAGIALGAIFHDSVDRVLVMLETMGSAALMVLGGLLALFIAYKYVERRRRRAALAVPRIGVGELAALMQAGHDPLMIDARSSTAQELDAAIPGALRYHQYEPDQLMAGLDKDRHIVVYCSCPNDVTAAKVAKQFLANGFHRARPLQGGLDAWHAHHAHRAQARPAPC